MKIFSYFGVLAMILPITSCHGEDVDSKKALDDGVATIREIWTEWLNKPPLESNIESRHLPEIAGNWVGEIDLDGKTMKLNIIVDQSGTWSSKVFRPEMKKGYWYLREGMILLYETKISDDSFLNGSPGVASALIQHKGKLCLLFAENESGYLKLVKEPIKP